MRNVSNLSAPLPGIGLEASLEINAKHPSSACPLLYPRSEQPRVSDYYTAPLVPWPAETAFVLPGEALPEAEKWKEQGNVGATYTAPGTV